MTKFSQQSKLNKVSHIHSMEYYAAVTKNRVELYVQS